MKKYLIFTFLLLSMAVACKKTTPAPVIVTPIEPTPTTFTIPDNAVSIIIKTDGLIVDEPKVKGTIKIMQKDSVVFENSIGIEIRGAISQLLYEKIVWF